MSGCSALEIRQGDLSHQPGDTQEASGWHLPSSARSQTSVARTYFSAQWVCVGMVECGLWACRFSSELRTTDDARGFGNATNVGPAHFMGRNQSRLTSWTSSFSGAADYWRSSRKSVPPAAMELEFAELQDQKRHWRVHQLSPSCPSSTRLLFFGSAFYGPTACCGSLEMLCYCQ